MATSLDGLQTEESTLANKLNSSFTPAPPTNSAVSLDKSLENVRSNIDTLRSTQLRNQWYGPSTTGDQGETPGSSDGVFMGALKALQRPENAVMGAIQYGLGKGTESSLGANINTAMKTGLSAGNILQQEGINNRAVQIPLGFALDVMFDPVNWVTMGSSTLVGGLGEGLVKGAMKEGTESGISGAIKAAGANVTSNLARKASTVMNWAPKVVRDMANRVPEVAAEGEKLGFGDAYRNAMTTGAKKYTNLADAISSKAIQSGEKYNALTGTSVYDKLNKGFFGSFPSDIIGKKIESGINKIPSVNILGKATPTGESIVKFFKYSPAEASDISEAYDKVTKLAKDKNILLVNDGTKAHFMNVDDALKPGATFTIPAKIQEGVDSALQDADQVINVADYEAPIKVHDTLDNAKALVELSGEDMNMKHLAAAYKITPVGKTGFEWYDKTIDNLKNVKVGDLMQGHIPDPKLVEDEAGELVKTWNSYSGVKDLKPFEKVLNGYQQMLSIFKPAKVMMNVASHPVAVIGNFLMGSMMGLPMFKPEYVESMLKSRSLVAGKLGAAGFKDMFFNDVNHLIDLADNNPTVFRDVTGIDANLIKHKLSAEEAIMHTFDSRTSDTAIKKVLEDAFAEVQAGLDKGEKLSSFENVANKAAEVEGKAGKVDKDIIKEQLGKFDLPSEQLSKAMKAGEIKRNQAFTSFTTSEITPNQNMFLDRLKVKLADMAATAPGYRQDIKLANALVNKMPAAYEHIDQTFKIGTVDYLTKVGLTEPELITVSRTVPINEAKDLLPPTIKNGQKFYKTTPLYASRVATEAFMNYAAMPDFVKMMRAIPFGSPFMSFPYAMAIKTAKTAINNPAIFNKVGFMLDEMNAGRSPLEKKAMDDKYNAYLKSPTVAKIFGMWNTDVKNLVPFYQMNMLNPSERTYAGTSFQTQMMKLSDNFPVLNDPVGSVFKDYFLQPWILSGTGEVAQGQFGQPIMPSYDENGKPITPGLGTKAFYAGRTLAESLVPGAASFAGLVNIPGEMSPDFVNAIPSYGFRNLANATQGRSSIGADTKEDAVRKTIRSLFGRTGLPAYTLDTSKTNVQ